VSTSILSGACAPAPIAGAKKQAQTGAIESVSVSRKGLECLFNNS